MGFRIDVFEMSDVVMGGVWCAACVGVGALECEEPRGGKPMVRAPYDFISHEIFIIVPKFWSNFIFNIKCHKEHFKYKPLITCNVHREDLAAVSSRVTHFDLIIIQNGIIFTNFLLTVFT